MSEDPFSGLTDTVQERKQREDHVRKQRRTQKWMAFCASLGATLLVAVATGAGAACGGWILDRESSYAIDRLLGGLVCGLIGGIFSFFWALWSAMRQEVINDVLGERQELAIGAALFWWPVVGTGLLGSVGAALGLTGRGAFRVEVLGCAVAAALLAQIPVVMLRRITLRTVRTRFGSATPWKPK